MILGKLKKDDAMTFLIIVLLFLVMLLPTSKNGEIIHSKSYVIGYNLSLLVVFLVIFLYNGILLRSLGFSLIILIYMLLITLNTMKILNTGFSFARFAPVLFTLMLFNLRINTRLNIKVFLKYFEIITWILLVGNLGIMLAIRPITNALIANYSQFNWFTVQTQIEQGKPVFTTGVHSYGAYIYFLFFLIWYIISDEPSLKKKRYYLYMLTLLFLEVLLQSSTGFMMAMIIMIILTKKLKKHSHLLLFACSVVIVVLYVILKWEQIDFNLLKRLTIGDISNGFYSRYASNIHTGNLKALIETTWGIGFTIPAKIPVLYTDSGYIVYGTMGNVEFLGYLYYSFYLFSKRSFGTYYRMYYFAFLIFEFALPGLLYWKLQVLFLITAFVVSSVNSYKDLYTNES